MKKFEIIYDGKIPVDTIYASTAEAAVAKFQDKQPGLSGRFIAKPAQIVQDETQPIKSLL